MYAGAVGDAQSSRHPVFPLRCHQLLISFSSTSAFMSKTEFRSGVSVKKETTTTTKKEKTTTKKKKEESFIIKCVLRTVKLMWAVTGIPNKIGVTLSAFYRYAQDSVDSVVCISGKARRKDRDGDQNSTDTKLYLEESVLERKLPEADLKALVDLPAGLDYNEWLASHTLALFEHVNLVYGTVSEFCTPSGCPDMTGPGNRTYLWFDEKGKKTRVAAPQYIDYVMTFTQKTVSDESIFPTKYANEFPGSFECIARKILRLQFHVIAHLYAAHFREIALLGLHTHLNLTFAHLTALHRRFNLIDEKETDVLRDLEVALRLTDDNIGNHVQQAPHSDSHNSSGSSGGGGGGGGGGGACEAGSNYAASAAGVYAAGSQQHVAAAMSLPTASTDDANRLHVDTATSGAPAMDSNGKSLPICTQPEAKSGGGGPQYVFGGGGGLMGGILGDFAGSDFSDNSRYCTSAVPPSSYSTSSSSTTSSTNAAAANASSNHGAGALHLNFSNNFAHAHHQHHPHHHHHHHHHQVAHQQNLGLLQCNANAATPTPHSTTTA